MSGLIKPFHIEVPQSDLDGLHRRLALTRWPSVQTSEQPWEQGVPLERARELIDYWQNDYSWRRCEEYLNQFDHFT